MLIVTVLAYVVSPLVVLAVLAAAGKSPLVALDALGRGTIGTPAGFAESIVQGTPLMLMSLGLAIAYRGKVWNIGAEGQQIFGAIMVTWFVLLFLKDPLPAYVMIPVALLFSLLGGALFAAIPAVMKSRLGINEVITTIMMTYVAVQALNWLVRGPFQDKTIPGSYPESPVFPPRQLCQSSCLTRASRSGSSSLLCYVSLGTISSSRRLWGTAYVLSGSILQRQGPVAFPWYV